MVLEETLRLHHIPATAHRVTFGLFRGVPDSTPMITFENGQYSVPSSLLVFVRSHGVGSDERIVVMHHKWGRAGGSGPPYSRPAGQPHD